MPVIGCNAAGFLKSEVALDCVQTIEYVNEVIAWYTSGGTAQGCHHTTPTVCICVISMATTVCKM